MSQPNSLYLDWPEETCSGENQYTRWSQPGSNICLDFHGDPANSRLVVFSDGNHHMALRESLDLFRQQTPGVSDIFYATTPPGPIINLLKTGGLQLGNLLIRITPHIFISPPENLDKLVQSGYMSEHLPFVQNYGSVLLVKRGNPKRIATIKDLVRRDVRLFISNPETEKASFSIYHRTLTDLTSDLISETDIIYVKVTQGQVHFGKAIHHREAPQAVADGSADVAIVFYHLALRYTRIFPDIFEAVPLEGSMEKPEPSEKNVVSKTHAGLIGDGGEWGAAFLDFLKSDAIKEIYRHHGLKPI